MVGKFLGLTSPPPFPIKNFTLEVKMALEMQQDSNDCGKDVTHTCTSCGDKQGVCGIEDGACWFTDEYPNLTYCDKCNRYT